jgi:hypothetical protein
MLASSCSLLTAAALLDGASVAYCHRSASRRAIALAAPMNDCLVSSFLSTPCALRFHRPPIVVFRLLASDPLPLKQSRGAPRQSLSLFLFVPLPPTPASRIRHVDLSTVQYSTPLPISIPYKRGHRAPDPPPAGLSSPHRPQAAPRHLVFYLTFGALPMRRAAGCRAVHPPAIKQQKPSS